jgi:hypothetical protein
MDLPAPLAWLVDEAGASPGPDRFLAELGGRLLADGLPLAGGALTLAVPHPIIARRTWLWRAETGAVIEALGFAGGPLGQAGYRWLAELGPVQEDTVGPRLGSPGPDSPVLGWAGTRPFGPAEADRLDFTAIGPAVNLVSRLEGLCRPLGRSVLISGAVAAETTTPLVPLGEHVLRGIAAPCIVFTLPDA